MDGSIISFMLAIIFVSGIAGLIAYLYISLFKLAAESVDSHGALKRYAYRYLMFSLGYIVSFMLVTPVILSPWKTKIAGIGESDTERTITYVVAAMPVAFLIYVLIIKSIRLWDRRKSKARERLSQSRK